ncbi:membrane protein [soil metagenome]
MTYRLGKLLVGLVLFALGVTMTVQAELGLAPWDVLHSAISGLTGLGFGTASVLVSIAVLGLAMALGTRPGIGTVLNTLLIGVVIELLLRAGFLGAAADWGWPWRLLLLVGGLATIGLGSALYIGAHLGSGPRDSLMVAVHTRFRTPIFAARTITEGSAFLLGWLLGGAVGIGTVISVLLIGPLVQLGFAATRQTPVRPHPGPV